MTRTIFSTAVIAVMTFAPIFLSAQTQDAENCKDHPFFNRLSKYYIISCAENYNEREFTVGNEKTETLEGTVTEIIYHYDGDYGPNLPSRLQVIKNYENAVLKMGGTKVYSRATNDGAWTGATFRFAKDNNEYWLGIYNLNNEPVDEYSLVLLTKEGMKQEITANEMFEKLNSGNSLLLYINFDTGKSSIKNESQKIIDELYTMLKSNSDLKIVVEGHTDNVGNKASNQSLSEQRAASLRTTLVSKGISADRIKSIGYGQDKPIADNTTEEGKAKNRRVEIKKM